MRALVLACVLATAVPAAAWAHGSSGQGYVSTIERIVNANGIDAEASGDGHFVFTAPAGKKVIVYGYSHEPFLRFENGKVYANEHSPSTYISNDEPAPESADAKAPPQWVEKDEGRTYTWHDHRTHWMASKPPAAVRESPDVKHHVLDWKVDGTVDAQPFAIQGSLDWLPKKSGPGYAWISYLAIAGGVLYAVFLLFTRRHAKR